MNSESDSLNSFLGKQFEKDEERGANEAESSILTPAIHTEGHWTGRNRNGSHTGGHGY